MDVVDDDDERPDACEGSDQLQERPSCLFAGLVFLESHRAGHSVRHGRRDPERGGQLVDRAIARGFQGLQDDLAQRPVGDALPVGGAAAGQDDAPLAGDRRQLGDEARLADAGLAEDRDELRRALGDDARERLPEAADLLLSPDERPVETAHDRWGVVVDVVQQEAALKKR